MTYFIGLLPFIGAFVAVLLWRAERVRKSPEQRLSSLKRLSDAASEAMRTMDEDPLGDQALILDWRDTAAIYYNSRTILLPTAKKLLELRPDDSDLLDSRMTLLRQHSKLRDFLLLHLVEIFIDRMNAILGASSSCLAAYSKPIIWAYTEEILLLENLLEDVSAPRRLTEILEEIL